MEAGTDGCRRHGGRDGRLMVTMEARKVGRWEACKPNLYDDGGSKAGIVGHGGMKGHG
jgi:hypothetical protein